MELNTLSNSLDSRSRSSKSLLSSTGNGIVGLVTASAIVETKVYLSVLRMEDGESDEDDHSYGDKGSSLKPKRKKFLNLEILVETANHSTSATSDYCTWLLNQQLDASQANRADQFV